MNTTVTRLILTLAVTSCALVIMAQPPDTPADTQDRAQADATEEIIGQEAQPEADATEEETVRMRPPGMSDIGTALQRIQPGLPSEAYPAAAKELGLDSLRRIESIFMAFREGDRRVVDAGTSRDATALLTRMNEAAFQQRFDGVITEQGRHSILIAPRSGFVVRDGEPAKVNAEEAYGIRDILSAADNAFNTTTEMLVMQNFMYWPGRARAKIYVIPDADGWRSVRGRSAPDGPVQMVVRNPETREFFLLVTPETRAEVTKAIAYAVAQTVLEEWAPVVRTARRTRGIPPFLVAGIAAEIAQLDSVLTEEGPRQLQRFTIGNNRMQITGREIRAFRARANDPSFQLPLDSRNLIRIDALVGAQDFPKASEALYYFVRQSQALVTYLQDAGRLPFLLMANALINGESFENAFENTYVSFRQSATPERERRRPTTREEAEEVQDARDRDAVLTRWRTFRRNAQEAVFHALTEEALREERLEQIQQQRQQQQPQQRPQRGR